MSDTASTAVERHQGQATLVADRHYMNHLPDLASQLAHSSMCPDTWRVRTAPESVWDPKTKKSVTKPADTPEEIAHKVGELAIIGQSLAELDLRLGLNVLPQVYVVKGRPGYMAQLQVMLAARFGCLIIPLDEESNDRVAVVKVLGKDHLWHRVRVTWDDAVRAKWPERNPNYDTMPDRMLMARAVTKAIGFHCPEAKLRLPPADLDEASFNEMWGDGEFPAETGEMISIPDGKSLVLRALVDRQGMDERLAAPIARALWGARGLPNGQAMMPRSDVESLLSTIPESAPDQAPDGEAQAESVGESIDAPQGPAQVIDAESSDTSSAKPDSEPHGDSDAEQGQMGWSPADPGRPFD